MSLAAILNQQIAWATAPRTLRIEILIGYWYGVCLVPNICHKEDREGKWLDDPVRIGRTRRGDAAASRPC